MAPSRAPSSSRSQNAEAAQTTSRKLPLADSSTNGAMNEAVAPEASRASSAVLTPTADAITDPPIVFKISEMNVAPSAPQKKHRTSRYHGSGS
ncbi:hypothetical protein D3C83_81180 [compost metagenome]